MESSMNGNKYHNQNVQKKDWRLARESKIYRCRWRRWTAKPKNAQWISIRRAPTTESVHDFRFFWGISVHDFVEVGMEITTKQRNNKGWEVALTRGKVFVYSWACPPTFEMEVQIWMRDCACAHKGMICVCAVASGSDNNDAIYVAQFCI